LALLAVVLAGCGEKTEPSAPPKATQSQAAGGGDEEPIRQRVAITVGKRAIKPARAQVDAFLGIRLVIRNASGREQQIEVRGAKPPRGLQIGPGLRANLDLEGLRPGRYRVQGEPTKATATLVVKRTTP
jgi:hypothetical protein